MEGLGRLGRLGAREEENWRKDRRGEGTLGVEGSKVSGQFMRDAWADLNETQSAKRRAWKRAADVKIILQWGWGHVLLSRTPSDGRKQC